MRFRNQLLKRRNRVKNTPAVALPVYSPEFGLQAAAARPAYGLAVSRASDTLLSCFLSLPVRFWVSTHQGLGMGGRLQARGGEKLPLIMAVVKASIKLHFVTPPFKWDNTILPQTSTCSKEGSDLMLTKSEQKMLEQLMRAMQNMTNLQKAQLCAFTEGFAMALEAGKAS